MINRDRTRFLINQFQQGFLFSGILHTGETGLQATNHMFTTMSLANLRSCPMLIPTY
ncbi:hypothetical protein N9235_03860 [Gammaproteobacteria bacterium]|nr:hypothetical protein [Gammaproteobacteria bacterium]